MMMSEVLKTTGKRVALLPDLSEEISDGNRDHRTLRGALGHDKGKNCIIAEIKFSSPSRGSIREVTDPVSFARDFVEAGCSALSVLTDPVFFQGSPDFIPQIRPEVPVPILRKDFIIDEKQLAESRSLGADAVLLIVRLLGEHLADMVESASSYGLEPLVEVHSPPEVEAALATGTQVIGINNRDLVSHTIDLSTTIRLSPLVRDAGLQVISESGFLWPYDVRNMRSYADGFLIGSAIMAAVNPARRLEGFVCA